MTNAEFKRYAEKLEREAESKDVHLACHRGQSACGDTTPGRSMTAVRALVTCTACAAEIAN